MIVMQCAGSRLISWVITVVSLIKGQTAEAQHLAATCADPVCTYKSG